MFKFDLEIPSYAEWKVQLDKLRNKTLRHESDITKSRRWRPRGEAASKILLL